MRISDWSSDVCSSDLCKPREKSNMRKQISSPFDCRAGSYRDQAERRRSEPTDSLPIFRRTECKWDEPSAGSLVRLASNRSERSAYRRGAAFSGDRKRVGWGRGGDVGVDLGGRRVI